MEAILDIEQYLDSHPGEHAITGGTMDPVHLGHCENLANAFEVASYTRNPLIVNPHSRSLHKNPIPLEIRRQLIIATIRDYFGEKADYVLCCDPVNLKDQRRWIQIRLRYAHRLLAVEGISPDDIEAFKRGRLTRIPRTTGVTGTMVRQMVREEDFQGLKYAVTRSVFKFLRDKGGPLYRPI